MFHRYRSWDHYFSWHTSLLLLVLHTFTESINNNMPMTASCSLLYRHPTIYTTSVTSPVALTLHAWFCVNGMALNPHKSETIVLGTRQWAPSYSNLATINNAAWQIPLTDQIILGMTLDKNLPMDNHVNSVSKSVHYNICALRHICPSISEDMAKMACALVGSILDYANSVLYGIYGKNFPIYNQVKRNCRVITLSR